MTSSLMSSIYDYFILAFVRKLQGHPVSYVIVIFNHRRVRIFTFRIVMYAHPQLNCVDLCRLSILE